MPLPDLRPWICLLLLDSALLWLLQGILGALLPRGLPGLWLEGAVRLGVLWGLFKPGGLLEFAGTLLPLLCLAMPLFFSLKALVPEALSTPLVRVTSAPWSWQLACYGAVALSWALWAVLSPPGASTSAQETKQGQENKALMWRLLKLSRPDLPFLIAAFFFLVMAVWCETFLPYYFGRITDILGSDFDPEAFASAIFFMCLFSFGSGFVHECNHAGFLCDSRQRPSSDVGMFVALTELGRPDAEHWNNRTDILERSRASVDTVCRHNYRLGAPFTVGRKVQPEVMVYPERTPSLQHPNLLLCSVTDFYPGDIKVRWFRNGQEEKAGILSTGLIRNGDWTFQTMVMLEMTPELGDVYTCLVDHSSLLSPVSVEWKAQSEYSWRKTLSGVGAFLFGIIFLLVGIVTHHRTQKGNMGTQLSDD
ncbi:PREDICTED: HLA class II histocompatibility antigen, DO beta chain-like [Chrysochloris asiatica]|uniref:HLA class II histocompatibility antigen, DO beta chain-like n=1 Tax=Chrysochloris asiatica TaxID=185453 RepID=A0A9B0TDQ2_CHRAS|nr:PREDICTED: HLA class II histocompatibility antigen, DO beta chain-like [Chrysochloris asiatica]